MALKNLIKHLEKVFPKVEWAIDDFSGTYIKAKNAQDGSLKIRLYSGEIDVSIDDGQFGEDFSCENTGEMEQVIKDNGYKCFLEVE